MRGHSSRWLWFSVWVAIGSAIAFGFLALGFLGLIPAALLALVVAIRFPQSHQSMFGLVSGIGIILLVIAYQNREGPGTTCWHTTTASGCDEHLNPLPWLLAGLALLVSGAAGQLRSR